MEKGLGEGRYRGELSQGSPRAPHTPRPLGIAPTAPPVSFGRSLSPRALAAQSLSPPSRWSRHMSLRKVQGLC